MTSSVPTSSAHRIRSMWPETVILLRLWIDVNFFFKKMRYGGRNRSKKESVHVGMVGMLFVKQRENQNKVGYKSIIPSQCDAVNYVQFRYGWSVILRTALWPPPADARRFVVLTIFPSIDYGVTAAQIGIRSLGVVTVGACTLGAGGRATDAAAALGGPPAWRNE